MNLLTNKPVLLMAIDDCETYTKGQREILKILVSICVDDVATVGTAYIAEKSGLSRPSIYLNINKFIEEGFLTRIRRPAERQDSYRLHPERFNYILQLYQNKKAMEID
jgi:hypothetical protein